jgi:hypothetical protein
MNSYKKIDKKGFYCSSDTMYFNTWTKLFILSAKHHAPWAHIHVHIFDPTESDYSWCKKNNISISSEVTPSQYCNNIETKKGYWVNMRFVRLPELYKDSTPVISVDADSVFACDLPESQFDLDMTHSWVTTAKNREQRSLGSAVGFASDSARHDLRNALLALPELTWYQDQIEMDCLLNQGIFAEQDRRYSDFKMTAGSYIWTGKGNRKFKKTFTTLAEYYRKGLVQ